MLTSERLRNYLPLFEGKCVVVVGDLYHDEYIMGKPSRISREAPIVVLEYRSRRIVPGGATAPACNVVALGGKAYQLGVIGNDAPGSELLEALSSRGVNIDGCVVDYARPTTNKLRVVAEGDHIFPQQVARIDHAVRTPINGEVERQLIDYLRRITPQVDAILFSDYKCGVVQERVIAAALEVAAEYNTPIIVDSQGDLSNFRRCTLIKCNLQEAEAYLGFALENETIFAEAMNRLCSELQARMVVITRGADGISVVDASGQYFHTPVAAPSEVFDVTGAGDAVIAVLALAWVAKVPLQDATHLANSAGQVVIQKLGNATIYRRDLDEELGKLRG
jgi:rfaE bifunctional protein kinase chain/domain